jgi:hypothetical protein
MDFSTKKFWVAQVLALIVTVAMFLKIIGFEDWMKNVMVIEGLWAGFDVAADFAKAKAGILTKAKAKTGHAPNT